jgi:hypothetical protein
MADKDEQVVPLTIKRKKAPEGAPAEPYEPPKLTKFEKLEKLIVSGE